MQRLILAGIALLACLAASQTRARAAEVAAEPPPAVVAPVQTWVLDGAYEPESTFGLALTDTGIVAHVAIPLTCPRPENGSCEPPQGQTGFLLLGDARRGVFVTPSSASLSFGTVFDPGHDQASPPPGFDPDKAVNDCEALENETEVQGYIASLRGELDARSAELESCLVDLHAAACEAASTLECVRARCAAEPQLCVPSQISSFGNFSQVLLGTFVSHGAYALNGRVPPLPGTRGGHYLKSWPGQECYIAIEAVRDSHTAASDAAVGCRADTAAVEAKTALLRMVLQGHAQEIDIDSVSAWIQAMADAGEEMRADMAALLAGFELDSETCSHERLTASCDLGPGDPRTAPAVQPSGQVIRQQSNRYLGRLSEMFREEALRTTDRTLAARYATLATRLALLPTDRVLDVTAPGGSPYSQQLVALRRVGLPDDGRSALAVVLTLVRDDGECSPGLNPTDRQLLDGALETFRETLAPGELVCPTCQQ